MEFNHTQYQISIMLTFFFTRDIIQKILYEV